MNKNESDKTMVILDIDGVVAELEPELVGYLTEKHGDKALQNRDMYLMENRFENEPEILEDALAFIMEPYSYLNLKPNLRGVNFAVDLIKSQFGVIFLSSRPSNTEKFTRRWLMQNVPHFNESLGVKCVNGSKVRMIENQMRDLTVFVVEDNPETCNKLNQDGILAYNWSQPWNQGCYPLITMEGNNTVIWESMDRKVDFWEKYTYE